MTALHELSARAALRAIADGDVSAEELVASCLDRIAAREDTVHAWAHLDRDGAIARARELDAGRPRGPLHGLPVGVKDIIDTADMPTTYGAAPYEGHRPARDAVCVERLRQAGAVIVGKTVTTEFACFHPGPTANPLDPSRTPGGSSSGSAAAVADHMVPVALGTQTAGSIVRPASFCGISGLKPTFGMLSLEGVKAVSPSLDTLGVLARDPDDCLLVTRVLADSPAAFEHPPDETLRVGFVRTAHWSRIDADAQERVDAAVAALERDGVLEEASLPQEFTGLAEAQTAVMAVEAAETLGPERTAYGEALSEDLLAFLDRGRELAWAHEAAEVYAVRCRQRLPELFSRHDVLLAPSVLGEPPPRERSTGDPLLCRPWTLLRTPCVAVPGLRGATGLPLGLQVVAPPGRDGVAVAGARMIAARLSDLRQEEQR